MSATPLANATLVRVRPPGGTDEWAGETSEPTKWSGEARVYWREKRRRTTGSEGSNVLIDRTLLAMRDLAIDWNVEDVATWRTDDGRQLTGTVRDVSGSVAPPGLEDVDAVVLDMEIA